MKPVHLLTPWGDVLFQVRNLHLELFALHPEKFQLTANQDHPLYEFTFPHSQGSGASTLWDNVAPATEIIEFHALERFLIEGPLSPIDFITKDDENRVIQNVLCYYEAQGFSKETVEQILNTCRESRHESSTKHPKLTLVRN